MCADVNPNQIPAPGSGRPEANAEKVRTPRYDWEHDIVAGEQPVRPKPQQLLKRSRGLFAAVRSLLRTLFNSDRNPFDRDDDPDPMAA